MSGLDYNYMGGKDLDREASLRELRKKYFQKEEPSHPTLMEEFDLLEEKKKFLNRLKRGEHVNEVARAQAAVAAAAAKVAKISSPKKKAMTCVTGGDGIVSLSPERGGGEEGDSPKVRPWGWGGGKGKKKPELVVVKDTSVKKEVSWEGYGLEPVWKGETDKPVETIWSDVMHRSHDITIQERQKVFEKMKSKIANKAKSVTTIADLDLSRSRIMAKLHRDTDPLKRGTAALLKLSPGMLRNINKNLQSSEQKRGSVVQGGSMASHGHKVRVPSPVPDEVELRRKLFVDVEAFVTPRRDTRQWQRELVALVQDSKKRDALVKSARDERRSKSFRPPSKEDFAKIVRREAGACFDDDEQVRGAGRGPPGRGRKRGSFIDEADEADEEEGQRRAPNDTEVGMGYDFKSTVLSVKRVNRDLHGVQKDFRVRYLRLDNLISKGGRDEAFEELGCDRGLYGTPMRSAFAKMQRDLEHSGRSIRKLRLHADGAEATVDPKVFRHPPFAPDIVKANTQDVAEQSLKTRIPKLLVQCTERVHKEVETVTRKAERELARLDSVARGLLRREKRVVEGALESQVEVTDKFQRRWMAALVHGMASRIWVARAFKIIHFRNVVRPKAATAIQQRWRVWHRKKTDKRMRVLSLILSHVVRRRRIKRMHRSADIIKTMLQETILVSRTTRAVRTFRLRVIEVQRYVLAWLACCREQKRSMQHHVHRAEKAELLAAIHARRTALRAEREKYERSLTMEDAGHISRPIADVFEGSEPFLIAQWPQLQVPAEVRERVCQQLLVRRRKEYVLDLHRYEVDRKRFKMLRNQYMMFTARVHQFAAGVSTASRGDVVSKIVVKELDLLSQRSEDSSKVGMARETAELLKKLHIPDKPVFQPHISEETATILARTCFETSGSPMLEQLAVWYREVRESSPKSPQRRDASSPAGRRDASSPAGRRDATSSSPAGRRDASPKGSRSPRAKSPLASGFGKVSKMVKPRSLAVARVPAAGADA